MSNRGGNRKNRNRLWSTRKRRGLQQKHVAFLLGKTVQEISRYERSVRLPQLHTLLALEIVYGAPLRVLFSELYEQVLADIQGRASSSQKSFNTVYADLLTRKGELQEYCSYEALLSAPSLSPDERVNIRDHLSRVSYKLADIWNQHDQQHNINPS